MDISAALIDYIQKELAIGRAKAIQPDDDLFSTGVLDSLGILQLVLFIERQLGIKVPDEDVVLENFQTVDAMTRYLQAKVSGQGPSVEPKGRE
jgi:acyl carrier protein